jgi:hypothetical protein
MRKRSVSTVVHQDDVGVNVVASTRKHTLALLGAVRDHYRRVREEILGLEHFVVAF